MSSASPGGWRWSRRWPTLRDDRGIDFVTANGENLAGGMGLTISTARGLYDSGVDVITSGNHIWDKREIIPELDRDERILRPINYGTTGIPGRGWGIFHALDGTEVAVVNAQGRSTMQPIDNPFHDLDRLLEDAADELPTDPPRRLPLRADQREDRLRPASRWPRQRRRRDPHPCADRRRADPAARHRVRQRPGHDRARSTASSGSPRQSVLPRFLTGLPTRFEVGSRAGRVQRAAHRRGAHRRASHRRGAHPAHHRAVTTLARNHVDLHCHTRRSDGVLEPQELYAAMRAWGLRLAAITDHDTLEGYRELRAAGLGDAASRHGPRLIPALEINTVGRRGHGDSRAWAASTASCTSWATVWMPTIRRLDATAAHASDAARETRIDLTLAALRDLGTARRR